MIKTKVFDAVNKPTNPEKTEIINFLFDNLQEYESTKEDELQDNSNTSPIALTTKERVNVLRNARYMYPRSTSRSRAVQDYHPISEGGDHRRPSTQRPQEHQVVH